MANLNPEVDAYLAKSRPFAQTILTHLRKLVHKACPKVEETIKWGFPFFEYKGTNLGNMSAFKKHCSFGFWGSEMDNVVREAGLQRENAISSLGRLTSLADLPPDKLMVELIKKAMESIDKGTQVSPMAGRNKVAKAPKPSVEAPELMAALKKEKKAAAVYAKFSPSAQREYVEWIAEAKRAETREKRIATALEWIAEGKQRNWKYQKG